MRVEVHDEHNPFHHWIATVKFIYIISCIFYQLNLLQIIENVGGRLRLRYDVPDNYKDSPLNDFWLFYLSPRLFRLGWVDEKGILFILYSILVYL